MYRLFVGNLSQDVDWKAIKDFFRSRSINVRHADVVCDQWTQKPKGYAIVEVGSSSDMDLAIESLHEEQVFGRRLIVREDREPPAHNKGSKGKGDWLKGDHGKGERGKGDYNKSRRTRSESPVERWDDGPSRASQAYRPSEAPPTAYKAEAYGERAPPCYQIYVGGLPYSVDWRDLKDLCKDLRLHVKHADVIMDPKSQSPSGGATIEFWDAQEVDRALELLQDVNVKGRRIFARPDRDSMSEGRDHSKRERPGAQPGKGDGKRHPYDNEDRQRRREGGRTALEDNVGRNTPQKRPRDDDGAEYRRLFCENLPPNISWQRLKDFFSEHFQPDYTDVVRVDSETAFGVVEFKSRSDALEACMQLNGVEFDERPVRLRQDRGEFDELRTKKRQKTVDRREDETRHQDGKGHPWRTDSHSKLAPNSGSLKVFVGNLDFKASWQDLKDHMRGAGNVRFCDILMDRNGKPKGCAMVEYNSEAEVEQAISTLSGTELRGRQIYVKPADRPDRQR